MASGHTFFQRGMWSILKKPSKFSQWQKRWMSFLCPNLKTKSKARINLSVFSTKLKTFVLREKWMSFLLRLFRSKVAKLSNFCLLSPLPIPVFVYKKIKLWKKICETKKRHKWIFGKMSCFGVKCEPPSKFSGHIIHHFWPQFTCFLVKWKRGSFNSWFFWPAPSAEVALCHHLGWLLSQHTVVSWKSMEELKRIYGHSKPTLFRIIRLKLKDGQSRLEMIDF